MWMQVLSRIVDCSSWVIMGGERTSSSKLSWIKSRGMQGFRGVFWIGLYRLNSSKRLKPILKNHKIWTGFSGIITLNHLRIAINILRQWRTVQLTWEIVRAVSRTVTAHHVCLTVYRQKTKHTNRRMFQTHTVHQLTLHKMICFHCRDVTYWFRTSFYNLKCRSRTYYVIFSVRSSNCKRVVRWWKKITRRWRRQTSKLLIVLRSHWREKSPSWLPSWRMSRRAQSNPSIPNTKPSDARLSLWSQSSFSPNANLRTFLS